MNRFSCAALAGLALALAAAPAGAGASLDAIRARGMFKCGVGTGTAGFGFPDDKGVWQGFNADVCRAVATMILNDPAKVQFVQVTAQQRFTALQLGEVDALAGNSTYTLTRDTQLGLNFVPPFFYDGQAMMVPRKLGVTRAADLNGATVCIQPGTTTELNLTDYFRKKNMKFTPVVIENVAEVRQAFFNGRCDVYSTDASLLAGARAATQKPDDYVILPERLSKEPLAGAVRQGDDQLYDIFKWTMYTLFEAEELGITKANLDEMSNSTDPGVRRFLGVEGELGKSLGVDRRFAYNVIKAVGNYGEIYEKWIGPKTPLKIERGLNNLWTNGGMLYAIPFR